MPHELVPAPSLEEVPRVYKIQQAPLRQSLILFPWAGGEKKELLFVDTVSSLSLTLLVLSNPFHNNLDINHIIRPASQCTKILFHQRVTKRLRNSMRRAQNLSAEHREQTTFTDLQVICILFPRASSPYSRSLSAYLLMLCSGYRFTLLQLAISQLFFLPFLQESM